VEYALTEKGQALLPIIEQMRGFGREWLDAHGPCEVPDPRPAAAALA
jgi:DNA-binding HxlR family transcriptional regulator